MATLNYSVSKEDMNRYRNTKLRAIVEEFLNSGAEFAEFQFSADEYKNAASATNNMRMAIKRMKIGTVGVTLRNGRVFLFKE